MCVTYANKPICFGWEDPYIQAVASRLHDLMTIMSMQLHRLLHVSGNMVQLPSQVTHLADLACLRFGTL